MSSRTLRRVGIIINYLALIILPFILYYENTHEFGYILLIAGIICFGMAYLTFYRRTGLWRLTHRKIEKLDEREIQLTHNALRLSYSIFTILILSFILVMSLGMQNKLNMWFDIDDIKATMAMNFFVLWYIAHTLPASIIAWREREV